MTNLRKARLLEGMADPDLVAIERKVRVDSIEAGQHVFREGDTGDGLYVIDSGRIQITAVVGDEQRRVLAEFGPGDYFGEMAILDSERRSADAVAAEASRVYFISREALLEVLERSPKLAMRMLRDFSGRLREIDRRYVREALQAERFLTINRFARSVIKEFKGPLHLVGISAEMMSVKGTSPELQESAKGRIRRQVDRMSRMIMEFLEFTRGEKSSVNLLEIDFPEFINEVVNELRPEAETRSVVIQLENRPPDVSLMMDSARLAHVVYSLISNAWEAMPGGGVVKLRFTLKADAIETEIEDTGKGIPPQAASRLFEPFYSHGKSGGTGLGLPISKRIIEDHNGTLEVRSEPGRGAIFAFRLPVASG